MQPHEPSSVVVSYKPVNKGALEAFVNLFLVRQQMIIKGCRLFRKDGKRWITLPQDSYEDRSGKTVYTSLIEFTAADRANQFQRNALQAVELYLGAIGHEPAEVESDVPWEGSTA